MDLELESSTALQDAQAVEKQKPLIRQPFFITVLVIAVLALASAGYLFAMNMRLQKDFDSQQTELHKMSTTLTDLSGKIDTYKTDNAKELSNMNDRTDSIAKSAYLGIIEHEIEGGIVTDDFYVDKIFLSSDNSGELDVIIDINTQPPMAHHYTGKGAFDLSDRELRAKSQAIIDAVKNCYSKNAPEELPKWDNSIPITLTIKNFPIGNSTAGNFKLVGEK
ncbi:hypothetical protein [Gorillibacterium massiliense]|uniref:hypothetical protein n=1 Tax=Gorillibacterium massiliense TaxID=1280390 RepID=UPI0004AE5871|nr:hypothetical protein [Gorillibacterium massiliense]